MVKLLSAFAPAKINLFLRIVGRRADGYHELDSVFVPISIGDRIRMEIRPCAPGAGTVTLQCDNKALPSDDRNLAMRAARALMAEFAVDADVLIDLHKEIPVGAGLGGGSSDAGTVLRMMAQLMRIEPARLAAIAVKLGADVPFFLDPVAARVGGIGERIAPLPTRLDLALVIAVAPIEISTAAVFRELKRESWSGAAPDADVEVIMAGRLTTALLVNDLATVAMARWPEIAALKAEVVRAGATAAAMSGSGGAVFGVFANPADAVVAAERIRGAAPAARVMTASAFHG